MDIEIRPVDTSSDLKRFVTFSWQVYHGDPYWVPPLINGQLEKLDRTRNPFWQTADFQLWMAYRQGIPAGTIGAILDHRYQQLYTQPIGSFGFFECRNESETARALLNSAEDWLRARSVTTIRGPYNPSTSEECGVLVEGHQTRPAILEAHTPPYYAGLLESAGYHKFLDTMARLFNRSPGLARAEDAIPPKLLKVAERAGQRSDLQVRPLNLKDWDGEIQLACRLYNAALAGLPEIIPLTESEFAATAASFKPFIDPAMVLVAEVKGQPVGFALALPDVNEALQHINGRLDLPGMAKVWWYSRRLRRVSFKILVITPEYQNRGIESVLTVEVARAIFKRGYAEIDMSLTGEDNLKSNRFQENLGFKVYRRYRIFEKSL